MDTLNHTSGQYFSIDDAKIYYETAGDKSNPALFLLHGGFGNMQDFKVLLPFLSENFYLIGIDSRGQGKSTLGKEKLTYERIQHDVEALLKFLNIGKFNILGLSDGGIVAYRLAALNSLGIDKIVTVGGTWSINDALLTKEIFLKITPDSWKEKFPDTYASYQSLNPEADFDLLTESLKEMWLDATSTGYPNETVHQINCPTLIVRGDTDHLFSRKSAAELTERIKDAALFNIPFAGHVAFEDQLEVFEMVVKQFLNE